MKAPPTPREKTLRIFGGLGVAVLLLLLVASPIALGLHLMGHLPLATGLLYGLALPMTLLFAACLVKFPWDTKIILTLCTGALFVFSIPVAKKLQQQRPLEHGPGAQPQLSAPSSAA